MRTAFALLCAAVVTVAAQDASIEARIAVIRAGGTHDAGAARGWIEFTRPIAGEDRPHRLYVPEGYDASRRHPLIVEMHGAVSRDAYMTDDYLRNLTYRVGEIADAENTLLLVPMGRRGIEWWTEPGSRNVLDAIAWAKDRYNIDESRVFAAGFSDGGSGSFYFALHHPSPFAGFVPMCGHVRVAGAGGDAVFLRNLANRPLYVINTGRDVLYPTRHVRPFIAAMKAVGVDVTYRAFEELPHAPLFMADERPRIRDWIRRTRRTAYPASIWIESDRPMHADWLELEALGQARTLEGWPDVNPAVPPVHVPFGIDVGEPTGGLGIAVRAVRAGSLAAALGVRADDLLVKLGDRAIEDVTTLRRAMRSVRAGARVRAVVLRGPAPTELEAVCPAPPAAPAFERGARRAVLHATRVGNRISVRSANVRRFAVAISPECFDLSREISIEVDGEERFCGIVEPDLATLDRYAARDRDRTRVYVARVVITL